MKTPRALGLLAALTVGAFVIRHSSFVIAQGPLTPSGAPGPTMKTLDQIDAKLEKRTPISSAPFAINVSGSYYLTGNLTVAAGDGIVINADDVTVDLNGFGISSTASPAAGIAISIPAARTNVTVRNGQVLGTTTYAAGVFTTGGFLHGVSNPSTSSANIRISYLNIQGMGGDGIVFNTTEMPTLVVERCSVTTCAGLGIQAGMIRDSSADGTGDTAIYGDVIANCTGRTVNTAGASARGSFGVSSVDNCWGSAVSGTGVEGITVSNSRGFGTTGIGLFATVATNSAGASTAGTGFRAVSATNCSGSSTSGPVGIDANPGTASFCRGERPGGTAIDAGIAIGCTVASGTVNSLNKFLGTP